MSKFEDFNTTLPAPLRDFIFDIHDATRRSGRLDEVQRLYEHRYKEVTDQYFPNAPWPDTKHVTAEVQDDEVFLALYREMAMRHITVKLKPQLNDHINSWSNYKKLFEHVLATPEAELCLSTQWIYDIMQEFAYQFQGFCQYRLQPHHNAENLRILSSNKEAWNLPAVMSILHQLIRHGKTKQSIITATGATRLTVHQQFGYFASIELARLECLLGDYGSSLAAVTHLKLTDRKELFMSMPICHFNVFYHIGVANMMLKKFGDALDVFSEIILYVIRVLKPGAAASLRPGVPQQLQRMVDRAMSLAAILITIKPNYRIEDQVRDAVEAKFGDKIKRLRIGDRSSAIELFESSCPKFISPLVPDYVAGGPNIHSTAFGNQSNVFITEVMHHIPFLKLRSLLHLYAAIDISKLSRFCEMTDSDLICSLLSFKNKAIQSKPTSKGGKSHLDVHFYVDGGVLMVDSTPARSDATHAHEKYFTGGVRKHREITNHLNKTFKRIGL